MDFCVNSYTSLFSSDAEEGEKEQEVATEEEEGPREMTLEEYKQKHSTVSSVVSLLDTWSVLFLFSGLCVCVRGGGGGTGYGSDVGQPLWPPPTCT